MQQFMELIIFCIFALTLGAPIAALGIVIAIRIIKDE